MAYQILYWITNTLVYAMQAIAFCCILNRRWSKGVTVIGLAAGFFLYMIPPQFMPLADIERIIFCLLCFPVIALVLFRDKWYKTLFCAVMMLVMMTAADLTASTLFFSSGQLQQGVALQPLMQQILAHALFLPLNGLLLWLFVLLMNRYKNGLSASEWLLYTAFPVSQYILLYGWILVCRADFTLPRVLFMLAGMAACLAADAALFLTVRGMAQRGELKARNDLLAEQIDHQKEHYAAITAQYQNIRHIRHDIANHLYTMQVLLENGEYDEAAAYTAKVSAACRYKQNLGNCENPIVDAFLYARTEELKRQGYDVRVQIAIPAETGIADPDLVVAFGNLLDNAAEASGGSDRKAIGINALMQKGFLRIEVTNSIAEAPKTKKRRIPQLERGIGIHICQKLAEEYQGSFTFTREGDTATATLFLKGAIPLAADRNL